MNDQDMLITISSNKALEMVCDALQVATVNNHFGVVGVHDLKATMLKKGVEFEKECRIYEICNPHQAKRVLTANMEISTALPCRVSVYEKAGKTVMATIRPTAMLGLFGAVGLSHVAEEVEETMLSIMREAAE